MPPAYESPGKRMHEQNKKKKDFENLPLMNPKYVNTVKLLIKDRKIKDANMKR